MIALLHLRLKVDGLSEKCRIDYADPEDIRKELWVFWKGDQRRADSGDQISRFTGRRLRTRAGTYAGIERVCLFSKTLGLVAISDTDLGRKAD